MRRVWPRRVAGLVAPLVAAGLLLSGCGGDSPEPKPLPKDSKSEPSASPSPTPPAMPAAAKRKTKAGAIAFTKTFIKTLNYSGASGDTAPFRRLFIAPCTRCEATADGIDKTYSAGGYFRGGGWVPTRFQFHTMDGNVAVLDAIVTYEAQTWVKQSGAKPVKYPSSKNHLKAFNVRWQSEQWRVSALDPTA